MRYIGIDLAWQGEKNSSAIAVGRVTNEQLNLESVVPAIKGFEAIKAHVLAIPELTGIAIDAPLIIKNETGQRACESELAKYYAARKASCHASNTALYPDAFSVKISEALLNEGFEHFQGNKWQFECYPHPALIEMFSLKERHLYKKGSVTEKKDGQIALSALLERLSHSHVLPLIIPEKYKLILDKSYIQSLKGQSLKSNEDALDAIICLYIAALKAQNAEGTLFGNIQDGYIWVPQIPCL